MSQNANALHRVAITGTGAYVPDRVLTNDDLATMVDTSDEWIRTRTGMVERHIAREDEPTSEMAETAAQRALEAAGASADSVDLLIVGTITSDMIMPSTACRLQDRLGLKRAACFDISAACSGFVYGMQIARQFIRTGEARRVLLIGADKMSAITDWEDRTTCVLFGDAAGAVVLEPTAHASRGIRSCVIGSDGSLYDLLTLPAGGSLMPASAQTVQNRLHSIKMAGNRVFKYAVRAMSDVAERAMEQAGVRPEQINWIIPHQANLRIIEAIADKSGMGMERFIVNLDRYGNTTAATVPLALDEAVRDGRIQPGDLILTTVFGGGFTWGAAVIEWGSDQ